MEKKYVTVLISITIIIFIVAMFFLVLFFNKKNNSIDEENINNILIEGYNYQKYDEGIAKNNLPKIDIGVIAEVNSTIDGKIPSYYNPVIPKGFKAITSLNDNTIDTQAKWGEQNAYLYGLVIEDSNQNQFVWIPVENMKLFKRTDWSKNEPLETIDSTYVEPIDEFKDDYYKMYYKVKKYGGFYVGRYEVGDVDSDTIRTTFRNSDNIGIRKNLVPYNNVPVKNSIINQREIIGSIELAKKFQEMNNYQTVKTSIIYGTQWDSMLRFIRSNIYNVNDSIKWGNYPISELEFKDIFGNKYLKKNVDMYLLTTGSSEQTKTKNIYDVAGNLAEWTMETANENANITRGGSYVSTIGQLASSRFAYRNNTINDYVGFRISFYIE